MKLELLSTNLIQIIERCLQSEGLSKLLYYNVGTDPLSYPDIDPNIIAPFGSSERIMPYPFDVNFKDEERNQLHIYYPKLDLVNNSNVEKVYVWFDIVVHKNLWAYSQDGKKLIRPYDIASEIARLFDGTVYYKQSTLGNLDFLSMGHVAVNEEFDAIRLEAIMTTF